MIAITGASGQLGRLVIESLLGKLPAGQIVALVRDPAKVADFAARGVVVRQADYTRPESLLPALSGVERLLLISGNEIGQRVPQHRAVIEAAKQAGIQLLAYTSILHADVSPLPLASEHKETEALIRHSGLPYAFLRNGWYTENYLASAPAAIEHGVLLGCAGEGRIASAARVDYAEAAAEVLTREHQAGRIYELAGDEAYTLGQLAAELARQSDKPVVYLNQSEADFKAALTGFGLPEGLAQLLAESDTGASRNGLFDAGKQLSRLIGRPTTAWTEQVKALVR
ncbi:MULTISPECIES: SDR family oxidoreductase [unclassified Uliginosibacterium]|jgi:NAD(P)H dehydrogenase (quinone)|uniref:SDR family oxidoreductase n=1 Tax=unclassified Uliginosibacterium TaxID=2621521 RepID=UPI000C7E505F|nr:MULTISPECIES: SDR family oxidoreductase [unclassified Uliginosibacterium]MDO6387820.1 SDR family oxidoreductase [Uliginosibacterium sp. 31-12]PLK48988.1 NAD(P)-dependent oxidoreductase [Uliginosibacterium sp. TH139]